MKTALVCVAIAFAGVLSISSIAQHTQPASQPATEPATQPASQPDNLDDTERDPEAVAVARRVMKRLGGEQAWADTRFVQWTFFGTRTHTWDKHRMLNRMQHTDSGGTHHVSIIDLNTGRGKAWRDGRRVTDPETLKTLLDRAHAAWINDSYWMFMPYKLLDTGVRLRQIDQRELEDAVVVDVLELTFEDDTGRTPHNKYLVYIDTESDLVVQWDYYERAQDRAPTLSSPWTDWKQFGDVWLSGDRGTLRGRDAKMIDIAVPEELPDWMFTELSAAEVTE